MYFNIDYYFNYFRYIGLKKRIKVFDFLEYYNVFDLINWLFRKLCLQLGSSTFEFYEKNQTLLNCDFIEYDLLTLTEILRKNQPLSELWFYWIWSFDIDWYEIESEPFDYALDPANGGKRWHRN